MLMVSDVHAGYVLYRTLVQQAIIEATPHLGYASVYEVQAKAVSYIVAGKDVFIFLSLYQENLPVFEAYHQCLTVLLGTNQATRQA